MPVPPPAAGRPPTRRVPWWRIALAVALLGGAPDVGAADAIASAAPVTLLPLAPAADGARAPTLPPAAFQADGRGVRGWLCDERTPTLRFAAAAPVAIPADGSVYVKLTYFDAGYGRISVRIPVRDGGLREPDRYLLLTRSDTRKLVTARMRFRGVSGADGKSGLAPIAIGLEQPAGQTLAIAAVAVQAQPFTDDAQFAFILTEPWLGPYAGPTVKPADNTTLTGKVMVGYQGWFRTPNDAEGHEWRHWGDIDHGRFKVDMWPDVTAYPAHVLEKAGDVKTRSGRTARLFSSTWPEVVDQHFRWMREHRIDGAFLQRFIADGMCSRGGDPEWVLANVRAAANREGRIWAIEYDVSGYPDAQVLETLRKDWAWFVDTFQVKKDPNYAREGGKPVVVIWGLPFPTRDIRPETANAVVEFFKNDPVYGGNYVIGGIPNNWRGTMTPAWREHITHYACVLPWMSLDYAGDVAEAKRLGIGLYPHVNPGMSWANLKHLPTGDTSFYIPREGGRTYWNMMAAAARAGADKLFVGMFDEYDEATAIMPMSDDPPPTPAQPGVYTRFSKSTDLEAPHDALLLPSPAYVFDGRAPGEQAGSGDYLMRMGGQILFPAPGSYTFAVEGVPGDAVVVRIDGAVVLDAARLDGIAVATAPVRVAATGPLGFFVEYRHGTGTGTFRLLWSGPALPRQPVPATAVQDAWGRFITNEGRPSDWWLKLTAHGREMINGTRSPATPMP